VISPGETLSIGFKVLVSRHPAIQTTGLLTLAPAGLSPAEHASLLWTHNWTLAIATLGAVVAFGSSDNLAGAYGIAVSLLMAITTVLGAAVAIQWGFNPVLVIAVNGFFLLVDLVFFAANSMKLFQGGWFPLLIAATIAFLMLTWRRGQQISEKARSSLRESEKEFVANLLARPPVRLPGTAAFLTSGTVGIPLTLTHHLKHIYALHERVLLVAVRTSEEPRVPEDERAKIQDLPAGITRATLHYGFMDSPLFRRACALLTSKRSLAVEICRKSRTTSAGKRLFRPSAFPACWYGGRISTPSCNATPNGRMHIFAFR